MANGLLSDIRKLLRPRLRERYGERLDQLYAELARAENDELAALRASGADQPVQETVIRAARALLGASSTEVTPDATFLDLGGDSLSALSFSNLLHDVFGVEVPVGVVINPAGDLRSVAAHIERLRDGDAVPTPASVHGPDAVEIRAEHLRLDAFLDPATLAAAPGLPAPAAGEPRTVLLTGATGFLGRFMCLDRLEQAARTGGTVVCVVRGSDDAAARRRLDETFDSGDPELLRHYRALAEEHLEVLAGDLGSPRLGLDEATWERLASEVDVVLHPGALVNHVLPYGQLFGPNVVGTAEVVRLALTTRLKPVVYLSTIGVADQIPAGSFAEETDIREMSAVRHVHDGYANGYAMSKWAGEVLLREAHDLCGLPVTVFRSDMILAHTRWAGQLNVPDVFTRLIVTLLATGLAPASFYEPGPRRGPGPRALRRAAGRLQRRRRRRDRHRRLVRVPHLPPVQPARRRHLARHLRRLAGGGGAHHHPSRRLRRVARPGRDRTARAARAAAQALPAAGTALLRQAGRRGARQRGADGGVPGRGAGGPSGRLDRHPAPGPGVDREVRRRRAAARPGLTGTVIHGAAPPIAGGRTVCHGTGA